MSMFFLIAYFLGIFLVTRLFPRRVQNLQDFFLAGRSLGSFPVALALAASWFGASSTLGSINAFHNEGLSGVWRLVIPSILSFIVITFSIAKRVARQGYLSQPEAVTVGERAAFLFFSGNFDRQHGFNRLATGGGRQGLRNGFSGWISRRLPSSALPPSLVTPCRGRLFHPGGSDRYHSSCICNDWIFNLVGFQRSGYSRLQCLAILSNPATTSFLGLELPMAGEYLPGYYLCVGLVHRPGNVAENVFDTEFRK